MSGVRVTITQQTVFRGVALLLPNNIELVLDNMTHESVVTGLQQLERNYNAMKRILEFIEKEPALGVIHDAARICLRGLE
jgi:hypothetical protein